VTHPFYGTDLAYVHDDGFSDYARNAGPEILRVLRERGLRRARIVELGCGAGTLAGYLANAGHHVVGIDVSAAMIQRARREAPAVTFRVGSLARTRVPPCDAVLAIGEVVSYLNASAGPRAHAKELAGFFERAHRALSPRGFLLFDFLESADGRTYPTKSRAGADWVIAVRAAASRTQPVLTRTIRTARRINGRWRQARESHRLRLYPRDDMRAMLRTAGFDVRFRRRMGALHLMRSSIMALAEPKSR
jgi:SAM-dependent methyltransferase